MRIAWFPVVVSVWCLAGAGEAVAQDSTPLESPAEEESSTPVQLFQSLRQFGSFGANVGGMLFLSDQDASDGALVRPSLQTAFRYRFNESWVGVAEFGFGWNAFDAKGDTVLTVTSGTLGLYRHLSDALSFDWKIGSGAGFYRQNYKFNGRSIRDPETQLHIRSIDPGLFLGLEVERRMAKHVTLLATGQYHFLFSSHKDDFPTLLGGNDSFVTTRIGVNYHFSPYEGILWERQQKRVIRLKSGKASS